MKKLEKRLLEISSKNKSSHIGSCLSLLPILEEIYTHKKDSDIFILSAGHSFLGWCVYMESLGKLDAEKAFKHHGTHPDRCKKCGIDFSSGSLGHGLGAAVGFALADRSRDVYCVISDGECNEGSIWEALRIKFENKLDNLKVYVNLNGNSALALTDTAYLAIRLYAFDPSIEIRYTESKFGNVGKIESHYYVLPDDYEKTIL